MADKTSRPIRSRRQTNREWISQAPSLLVAAAAAGLVFFQWANWPGSVGFGGGIPPVNFDGIDLVNGQLVLGVTLFAAVAMSLRWHLVAAALSTGALYLCVLAFLDMVGSFVYGECSNIGWALYSVI